MNLFHKFLLALLSVNLFLAGSTALPRASREDHPHLSQINKRAPPAIESWPLYIRWSEMVADPDIMVPGIADVEVGHEEGNVITYVGEGQGCREKKATKENKIAALYTIVWQGTLVTTQDGDSSSQKVAIKGARGNNGDLVIYGGTLQKQFSDNANILPVIDYLVAGRYKYLIMPWVEGKSLESNFGSFSSQGAVNSGFKQVLNAVSALHGAGIMHRDLKPENLLFDSGTLKLMDFDHATKDGESYEYGLGTPSYAAPEILAMRMPTGGGGYTKQIDVFAIGMTFLVMSVPDLQNEDNRFLLWKDLVEPDGEQWPSANKIAGVLSGKSYSVFSGNENLLNVIAKSLCSPTERYADAVEFQSAFNGVA